MAFSSTPCLRVLCLCLSLTFCDSTLSQFENSVIDLKFSVEPQDVVVEAGRSLVLGCAAESSDPARSPRIKWRTSDGQDLTYIGDPYRRLLSNHSLLLLSVTSEQEQYQCVATVTLGTDSIGSIVSRTATVTLAQLPPFEIQPRDLRLFPGQTALFSCLVEGRPAPNVRWLKDSRPLVLEEARMTILPSGSLEIEAVQVSDRGSYRCNVSSATQHRLSDKALLEIDQDIESAHSLRAPSFIARPRATVVTQGSTVTLECAANGYPQPWFIWLKDGVAIDLLDLDTNCLKVGTGSLQLRNVQEEDAGTYQCRAENKEDSVDATATLQVHVAPRFIKRPTSKVAREKEDVELECSVYAEPEAKVSWLKNGDRIMQNEYLQVINGNNLRILGLMSQDAGLFQCVAFNPAGNIQAAAHLIITNLVPEVEPRVQWAPQNVEAAIVGARFVTLRWKPPPQAPVDISSYSVFYREEGSNRERVVNTSRSRLEEVNIQGLQPDRSYVVRVGAHVGGGLGAMSPPLAVRTKAEAHVPGAPLHLSARPLSPTAVRVDWSPPAPDPNSPPVLGYSLYYIQADASDEFYRNTTEPGMTLSELDKFMEYSVWAVAHNENGAGTASEEVTVRTFSDVPSKPPENITLEAASSTTVYVRWEPPPRDGRNGVITGYKVRYRKKDMRGRGDTQTAAGNQRLFVIQNLDKRSVYQVRLFAINVNGSSPPTDWFTIETYENDLDESTVPDQPISMRVKPSTDSVTVYWQPPANPNIMVRGYKIGWGKGIPDAYSQVLEGKQRQFVIESLEPNSEYVISLRANNEMGDGPAKYESVRTRDETPPEPPTPLIPPVGLKAEVLSSSSVVVYWTDSTLSLNQLVTDSRYYTVRYASCHHSGNPRYKYYNTTDLNFMIDDLKPNTQYEFTVKVVKGRRESRWSMVVSNTTLEDAPTSPPRDLTVVPVEGNPSVVNLNWQPPKQPNGLITGYVVSYTTDLSNRDRDWVVEGVVGDKMTTSIKGLTPTTTYYFKIQARNSKGYGPTSNTVSVTTPAGAYRGFESSLSTTRDGRGGSGLSNSTLLLILVACCVLLVAGVAIGIAIVCCRKASSSDDRNKKGYTKGNTGKPGASNIKPPDLWIHHDQMDLKNMEKSSQGSLEVPSSARDLDMDPPRHQPTNSLDKRTYGTSYIGNASQPLLLPEEKSASARRVVKAKPIALPVESQPLREPTATVTVVGGGPAGLMPMYPRTQYTASRAHVTLDPNTSGESSSVLPSGAGGYESIAGGGGGGGVPGPPTAQVSNYGVTGEGTGSLGKRMQGHPLKSFSVPAPPPQSAPSTPQQKHVVTVRPQGSSSPYKKAGHYSGSGGQVQSPAPTKSRATPLEDSPKLQPSYSTEELNQEMANLEGLMKDLNAITASEFEC